LSFYRLQYTTKGTKALRLLGDRSVKTNCDKNSDQLFDTKDSALAKLAARGHSQRRLLLKNGEVNISRYLINFCSSSKAKKIGNCSKKSKSMPIDKKKKKKAQADFFLVCFITH